MLLAILKVSQLFENQKNFTVRWHFKYERIFQEEQETKYILNLQSHAVVKNHEASGEKYTILCASNLGEQ